MTIEEVVNEFKEKVPNRRPIKYARVGDTWYIYSENIVNGGAHLSTLIDASWYSVAGSKVIPVVPLDMPRDLSFIQVPYDLRTPKFIENMK